MAASNMENSRAKKCMSERIISVVQQVFHPLMLMLLHSTQKTIMDQKSAKSIMCDLFPFENTQNSSSKPAIL